MNVREFLKRIDLIAPFSIAEEWDNPGLMVGSYDAEVKKVGITLDPISEAVISADENECDVLLCHHPLIFKPIKKIDLDLDPGRAIYEAIKRNIAIISAHTNWDFAPGGLNSELAKLLGLFEAMPLELESGIGVRGVLSEEMNLDKLLEKIKNSWNLTRIDCFVPDNLRDKKITHVALCGGAGSEFWRSAKNHGAEIYITSDMKYHEIIDANRTGLIIASVDHGEMERASLPELAKKISAHGDVEVLILDVNALNSPIRI